MKRLIFIFIMAATLSACYEPSESAVSAQPGETYNGTVTEISLDSVVITTDDGEVEIPYSEDTVFSGFSTFSDFGGGFHGRNGGGEPGRQNEPIMSDEETDGQGEMSDTEIFSDEQTGPVTEDESGGLPERQPAEQEVENTIQDLEVSQSREATIENVSLNDVVTAVVNDDGVAETITLSNERAGNEVTA